MSAGVVDKGAKYAGFLNNDELGRLATEELRRDVYFALRARSLGVFDWRRVREEAGAAGLEVGEMSIPQLRRLLTAIEEIELYRPPAAAPAPAKKKGKVEKPFGWAE
ncbi:MAG TPA: hypothetical protein PLJ47_07680 [Candidatus Hydrogenedentes bacterium]|nr:hypothetical protein [Candidatus Hydrogenedentota bacterium]HRK34462.1 hypothetical protein [Candidatus Hydrogenedentota bacterium]